MVRTAYDFAPSGPVHDTVVVIWLMFAAGVSVATTFEIVNDYPCIVADVLPPAAATEAYGNARMRSSSRCASNAAQVARRFCPVRTIDCVASAAIPDATSANSAIAA